MEFNFSRSNLPRQLFINNEYVESQNPEKLSLFNPKDGSLVANDISLAGPSDVDYAVHCAESAFPMWKKTLPTTRRDILNKFGSLIDKHLSTLADLTRLTLGSPFSTFGIEETSLAAEAFRYYAGWVDKFPGQSFPQDDGFLKIVRNEPLGVTAGIVPWNTPLGLAATKAAPALAAGNCFILKPSEKTPFAALALGALIVEAGFPPGVFQVLPGDGSTGQLLAYHMRIRKIGFTGSVATGKKVQEAAAKSNLKRVTLELGGKSPAIIFDDAILENAIMWTAKAITAKTGQVCFAATRIYAQEGIYERFLEGLKSALKEIMMGTGDPDAEGTLMGPLVDQGQFERVVSFIERGKSGQGTLLFGGSRIGDKGYFIEPTLFADVPPSSELMRDEIFGPVAVINSFKTEEEIVEKANDTEFGLMTGLFTQDINRALRMASDFETGMVNINCMSVVSLGAPFGGSKQSGIGKESGIEALMEYTEQKTVMINMMY